MDGALEASVAFDEGEPLVRFVDAIHDAIETKKFGGTLSEETIGTVIEGYTEGEIPDYQMASLLMAIFIRGMSYGETLALTKSIGCAAPWPDPSTPSGTIPGRASSSSCARPTCCRRHPPSTQPTA
jgi:hypothetical protein